MPWTVTADAQAVRFLQESMSQRRLAHAYLLAGPAGVGAVALARQFAQALLCAPADGDEPPCGTCRQCRRITNETHADVLVMSPAAGGAIGIETVRDVQAAASLQPFESDGRVLIITEADTLTREAGNALLKHLEEPPAGVTLILVTANEEAVPDTVRSRCQIVHLRPLPFAAVREALIAEGVEAGEAERLARVSGGRLEFAMEMSTDTSQSEARHAALAEIVDARKETVTARLTRAGKMADDFYKDRRRLLGQLDLWSQLWRDVLLVAAGAPEGVTDSTDIAELESLDIAVTDASSALSKVLFTIDALNRNANARLALEALLLHLPQPQTAA